MKTIWMVRLLVAGVMLTLGGLLLRSKMRCLDLEMELDAAKRREEQQEARLVGIRKSNEMAKKQLMSQLAEIDGRATDISAQAIRALEVKTDELAAYKKAYGEMKEYAENLAVQAVDNTPLRTPNSLYQKPADSSPSPALVTGNVKVAPLWQLPARAKALDAVTKRAKAEWGNNFSMVNHEIERQMEGYDKVAEYHKQAWKPLMRTLLNEAGEKWPNSFAMMVYEIERQIEAKDKLDGKK